MRKPSCDTQFSLSSAHKAYRAEGIPPNHWCDRFFELVEHPSARTLEPRDSMAWVLEENCRRGEDDDPRPLEGDEPGNDRIATQYEPGVRVGTKKHTAWTGGKVHLMETADGEQPNFVVDVLVTEPTAGRR